MPTPGRWKDPDNEYRVLYFSDNHVGAYVETLQNLRPEAATYTRLAEKIDGGGYGDPPPDVRAMVVGKLKNRRSTIYYTSTDDHVADILAPSTKSALEVDPRVATLLSIRDIKTLKNGDMSAGDYKINNAISRVVYETEHAPGVPFCGICCPSAEIQDTKNYSLFETGRDTRACRATLVPHLTDLALDERAVLQAALEYLDLS